MQPLLSPQQQSQLYWKEATLKHRSFAAGLVVLAGLGFSVFLVLAFLVGTISRSAPTPSPETVQSRPSDLV